MCVGIHYEGSGHYFDNWGYDPNPAVCRSTKLLINSLNSLVICISGQMHPVAEW